MLRCAEEGDTIGEAAADAAFHAYLVDRAGNGTLRRVWGTLEPYSRTYINMAIAGADRRLMAELHRPILDAVRSGDADARRGGDPPALRDRPPVPRRPLGRTIGAAAGARRIRPRHRKDPMNAVPQLTEEFTAGAARLRVDVIGGAPRSHVLDDLSFLDYRLADVHVTQETTLEEPDITWIQDGPKSVTHVGRRVTFTGDWAAGPLQKVIVAVLALKLEDLGLHASHGVAVNYRGKTFPFLGGEGNRGKTMCLIEAGVRGARQVSSETTVIDEDGRAVMGSRDVFLRTRSEGTERSDKAAPNKGVVRFWGELPSWELYEGTPDIDLVIVPMLDGNADTAVNEMSPFERQFQFLHSLQNYFLTNELLAPGHVMPLLDTDELRARRAAFVERFCERPFYFIRAATPQLLLDEVEKVL